MAGDECLRELCTLRLGRQLCAIQSRGLLLSQIYPVLAHLVHSNLSFVQRREEAQEVQHRGVHEHRQEERRLHTTVSARVMHRCALDDVCQCIIAC